MSKKVLITGASGLLGSCFLEYSPENWELTGICNKNIASGLIPLDISDAESVHNFISDNRFDIIIHCAALRDPDYCYKNQQHTVAVNVQGTANIAVAAKNIGAQMVYISTDYVFSGENPPYNEDSEPCPVNFYGQSKLLGEVEAKRHGECLICRIPALFRPNTISRGNWVTKLAKQFSANEVVSLDAETVRYYTAADDIARAVIFLADSGFNGTCHLSSEKQTTKAGFARIVASQLGFSNELVKDSPPPGSDGIDRRPHDSHLNTSKYKSLNGPPLRDYDAVLSELK